MNKGLRWKETIAGVEAPNLMVVETQLPAGRNQTFATPADIIACLAANPEAAGQVLLALESQYIAGETAKHIARASRAEQALATVTAERDAARDRAERAEVQLAGCGSAALGYVDPPAKKGDYGWSASYGDVLALRAQLAKTEAVVEAARRDVATADALLLAFEHGAGGTLSGRVEQVTRESRHALRALDSPVGAGTDSGGSGAATPEGGHAAPTGGPMPPPEPAGSSLEATRDPQAPATRAELEALRVRVERLEQLTGFVPKE